ncbi:hypothetical protein Q757_04360 [Oenococcus alcoholitolerans]|uniref:Uncharacterized protein n=1 Tax=Oenococcus alcoholitolerans TaxID=931074 RepID=A0ABR4XRI2_9LACO|nr:hypothetical protein Q757_04360 [Oenococcus alcoholitolerans]
MKDKEFNKRPARKRTQAARPDLLFPAMGPESKSAKITTKMID